MGIIIDFYEWKKKKADEEAEREIIKVRNLSNELSGYLDEIHSTNKTGSHYVSEEFDEWTKKAVKVMLEKLSSYKKWPIDSTDM